MRAMLRFDKDATVPRPVEERRGMAVTLLREVLEDGHGPAVAFEVVSEFLKLQGMGKLSPDAIVDFIKPAMEKPAKLHS